MLGKHVKKNTDKQRRIKRSTAVISAEISGSDVVGCVLSYLFFCVVLPLFSVIVVQLASN